MCFVVLIEALHFLA